jgi:mannose/cellobiose epimerase-like protein (N-acyl-D-glucosamine 2-epimerase family)
MVEKMLNWHIEWASQRDPETDVQIQVWTDPDGKWWCAFDGDGEPIQESETSYSDSFNAKFAAEAWYFSVYLADPAKFA